MALQLGCAPSFVLSSGPLWPFASPAEGGGRRHKPSHLELGIEARKERKNWIGCNKWPEAEGGRKEETKEVPPGLVERPRPVEAPLEVVSFARLNDRSFLATSAFGWCKTGLADLTATNIFFN